MKTTDHPCLLDVSSMSKDQIIEYYKAEAGKIIDSARNPEALIPIMRRFLMRLQNQSPSNKAFIEASNEMWASYHKLNDELAPFRSQT